ncbi:filamentous hemagglutinin N-terminal domain-containing protein [Halomonas caseinilytica]|uniref:filamentous hemagglutinin N-terminal domain-containing protein n=1 Tax=Halomonas caseinilytica TaxID=438744 RepID=UPI0009F3B6D3|nr:filamentous hemagglutinin N-terminal domain-containing protein [Halomonas caseinilytica]
MKKLGSLLLWSASVALSSNALAAGITVSPSQAGTSVSKAASGSDVVNIAAPDANGISHNTYTDFNVGTAGVVLNNSATRVQTDLAGAVEGNVNLAGHTASVILNEVVGGNASKLGAGLELAGADAKVILANPNGITCSGCEFFNIEAVDLVAGAPDFFNGELQGFRLDEGDITVDWQGMRAGETEQLKLMANSILVDGKISANDVSLITNRGHVRPDGTIRSSDDSWRFPKVAIDVTSMGGIHGSNIQLVSGNRGGVGVNVDGALLANSIHSSLGRIDIDAYGDINIGQVLNSSGDMTLTTAHSVRNRGQVFSDRSLYVTAKDTIDNNHGNMNSFSHMALSANHLSNVWGNITSNQVIDIKDTSWFGVNNTFGEIKAGGAITGNTPWWLFNVGGVVDGNI